MDHSQHTHSLGETASAGGVWDFFSSAGFMPHGHCYLWQPALVWTHVISDILIGAAYLSISFSLYALIKKIRLPFSTMVLSFGIFIAACGATHFMEVWNLWKADYWVAGFVKVLTAAASIATGVWLIRLKPRIIEFAYAAKLSEERRELLETTNVELQRRTEELAQTNVALAEQQKALAHSAKMSALGEMAGGIAHEINSPLGIITLHAQQLERMQQRQTLTPEIISQEAQLIGTTAKRIGDIIKGLRAFAREGENDPFEPVPLALIVEDALVLCRARFKAREIDLRVGSIPTELSVECRAVQIGQVLLNLLTNAFDAVQALPERWVSIEIRDDGDNVEIAVTDSGRGVPAEIVPKLMQPFFTTKEVGKGTGLGLSISKGIVDNHNGSLELDASSAHTRFVIRLPKRRPIQE